MNGRTISFVHQFGVQIDDDNSDVIVKMPSYPALDSLQIRVPHLTFLGSFLKCSFYETPRNPSPRMTVDNVNSFFVAQMLPKAILCKNHEFILRTKCDYTARRLCTHNGPLQRLREPKPSNKRWPVKLRILQIKITD